MSTTPPRQTMYVLRKTLSETKHRNQAFRVSSSSQVQNDWIGSFAVAVTRHSSLRPLRERVYLELQFQRVRDPH